jgi:hypothetical protein
MWVAKREFRNDPADRDYFVTDEMHGKRMMSKHRLHQEQGTGQNGDD